jgi:hypothetical protein
MAAQVWFERLQHTDMIAEAEGGSDGARVFLSVSGNLCSGLKAMFLNGPVTQIRNFGDVD